MVEEDNAVMSGRTHLANNAPVRMGKSDAFAMRHAKITERRVVLIHLTENDDKQLRRTTPPRHLKPLV